MKPDSVLFYISNLLIRLVLYFKTIISLGSSKLNSITNSNSISNVIQKDIPRDLEEDINTHVDQFVSGTKTILSLPLEVFSFATNSNAIKLISQNFKYNFSLIIQLIAYNYIRQLSKIFVPDKIIQGTDLIFNIYVTKRIINNTIYSAFNNITAPKITTISTNHEHINCDCSSKKIIQANLMSTPYYIGNKIANNFISNSIPCGDILKSTLNAYIEGLALDEYNYANLCTRHRYEHFQNLHTYHFSLGLSIQTLENLFYYILAGNNNIYGLKNIISMVMYPLYIMLINKNGANHNFNDLNYPLDITKIVRINVDYLLKNSATDVFNTIDNNKDYIKSIIKSIKSNKEIDVLLSKILDEEIKSFNSIAIKNFFEISNIHKDLQIAISGIKWSNNMLGYIPNFILSYIPENIISKNTLQILLKLLQDKDVIKLLEFLQISIESRLKEIENVEIKIYTEFESLKIIKDYIKNSSTIAKSEILKLDNAISIIEGDKNLDKQAPIDWDIIKDYFKSGDSNISSIANDPNINKPTALTNRYDNLKKCSNNNSTYLPNISAEKQHKESGRQSVIKSNTNNSTNNIARFIDDEYIAKRKYNSLPTKKW